MTKTSALTLVPAPEPMNYRLVAPSRADTPRIAREWVVLVLRTTGLGHLAERARLCTSEVVTNAYRHTDTAEIAVEAVLLDGGITVYVYDSAPEHWPGTGRGLLGLSTKEGGRGLGLVAAYADEWAVIAAEGKAKAVWFSLTGAAR